MKFTIFLEPRTKKNHQRIVINKRTKVPMVIPSPQYKLYEQASLAFMPDMETIDYPVEIEAVFYMKTKRRVDLTNLLESLDDILVKHKVIIDDNSQIVVSHDGSRVLYDKDNPRTEVTIRRLDDVQV